jgi:hypothetical protein
VTRARTGFIGCLLQVGIIFFLGAILIMAVTGLFYPWAFYLGGTFHILPYWQGWGKLHAKSGDYVLFIYIHPTPSRSKLYLETSLTGDAYVCTPRGENIRMRLGGGMPKHLNLSTDGEPVYLYMYHRPWNAAFLVNRSPRLEFRGWWRNPSLVMDDHGSIARAFQPDGAVYHGSGAKRPYLTEVVPVTLNSGSYSQFRESCASVRQLTHPADKH